MMKSDNLAFYPTEQISERTGNVKTYLVGPGIYHAFAAGIPLHIQQEDDSWSPVLASFQLEKESSDYNSRGSRFTTVCSSSGSDHFITISDFKGHSLFWGIAEAASVKPEIPEQEKPETKNLAEDFVAAMKRGPYDYHFIRLTKDGWFNKPGTTEGFYVNDEYVFSDIWYGMYIDNSGTLVVDYALYYDDETIFFTVREGWDQ